jgi:hypothetical protein
MLLMSKLEADWVCDKHGTWIPSLLQSANSPVEYSFSTSIVILALRNF